MRVIDCKRHIPVLVFVILAAVFIIVEIHMALPDDSKHLEGGKLSDSEDTRIDIFLDLTKIFINLGIAIIGGVGLFLRLSMERSQVPRPVIILGISSIACAATSVFLGHMSYTVVLFMLSKNAYPDWGLYGVLQYVSFLAALLLFFAYANYTIWDQSQTVATDADKQGGKNHEIVPNSQHPVRRTHADDVRIC